MNRQTLITVMCVILNLLAAPSILAEEDILQASGRGNVSRVRELIQQGVDVNATSSRGVTALMAAAHYGHTAIVKMLIESGAKVNAVAQSGSTALISASGQGHTEIVRLLLKSGADTNARFRGKSALDFAEYGGHREIVTLLRGAKAESGRKHESSAGPTPSHPLPHGKDLVPVASFGGTGQGATALFTLKPGLWIFRLKHFGDHHFGVWLLNRKGKRIDLLVNKIASFSGSKAVQIMEEGQYLMDVSADGQWSIAVTPPEIGTQPHRPPVTYSGTGQQTSAVFALSPGLTRFSLKHDGDAHFGVWLLDTKGNRINLLVNKVGKFDGSKALGVERSGLFLLGISADGDWRISIAQ